MAEEEGRVDGSGADASSAANLKRLDFKKQSLDDAYAAPANLLEIEVCNASTHGLARNRFTDYEIKMRVCKRLSALKALVALLAEKPCKDAFYNIF